MILVFYTILHFFNVGLTGAIIGIIAMIFLQSMILKKWTPKNISYWLGEKTKDNDEIKKYAIAILSNSVKKATIISLSLMPILGYFEFGISQNIRIGKFYLSRVLSIPIIIGVFIIMVYPLVKVQKKINEKYRV